MAPRLNRHRARVQVPFMGDKDESFGMDSPGEEELGQAILAYLAEHPRATDTLQGIAEWWVLRRLVQVEVPRVEQVGAGPSPLYRAQAREAGTGGGIENRS